MAEYMFQKDSRGRTSMVLVHEDFEPLRKPSTTAGTKLLGGSLDVWHCLIKGCGRDFIKPHLFSRHFNTSHLDLAGSKDAWRDHFEMRDRS